MALRTVKINLNDRSYDLPYVTPFFVMTKLNDGEIKKIVNETLDDLTKERITFFETFEHIVKRLSSDVHPNSHKTIDFDFKFDYKE